VQTVGPDWLTALDQTGGRERLGIINTLGNRRSAFAVGKLGTLLSSQNSEVASEAAKALGRIGNEDAARHLEKLLESSNDADINVLADAYLACADRLLERDQKEPAAKIYKKVFRSELPSHIRSAALKGLACTVAPPAVLPVVTQALAADNSQLTKMATHIARQLRGKETTKVLAQRLPQLPPQTQVLLLHALAVRRDRSALAAIEEASGSPDSAVRVAALEAIGQIGDDSVVGLLAQRAATASSAERAAARKSLSVIHGDSVNTTLVAELGRSEAVVDAEIIGALARRGATEAVPALLEQAENAEPVVRVTSFRAMRELAGAEHLERLIELLVASGPDDASAARAAVVAVARRNRLTAKASAQIANRQGRSTEPGTRKLLLLTLGDLGDGCSLPTLRNALKDRQHDVRRGAISALSAWPNAEPMGNLLDVARHDPSKAHRILALRGFIDLVSKANRLSATEKVQSYETAMELASDVAEKKRILSGLARLEILDALRLAEPYLQDAQLQQEAALAVTTISSTVYMEDVDGVRAALEHVRSAKVGGDIEKHADEILNDLDELEGYLLDWVVAGPYTQEGKTYEQLFDISFAPELPGRNVQWLKMPVCLSRERLGYLDLLKQLNGGEQRVAYLRTELESDKERMVVLEVFTDDGVKLWLNGRLVHANNVARPIMPEPDRIQVRLHRGINQLLLKVTQNDQAWAAIVRTRAVGPVEPRLGEGFRLHTINDQSRFEAAGILDINRDGKLDIFCGGFWYEAPTGKKHFVREVPERDEYHYDFANIPVDVDGDGFEDIVNAAWHNKTLFWVRNPGSADGQFQVIEIDRPGNIETLIAVDINGDGQLDILPNISGSTAWYEYKGDPSAEAGVRWDKHLLPACVSGHGIGAGDIDGDGRCDIVGPRGWLGQPAKDHDEWQCHQEFDLGTASIPIIVHDVDTDGDSDIIWGMGHEYGIFWLEQRREGQTKRYWRRHRIDRNWSQAHFLLLADLNNDGIDELVTGKRYRAHNGHDPGGNDPLGVYYYRFDPATQSWKRHLVHEGGQVGFGINTAAADIDNDGDVDIVAPGKSGLYLLENLLR
jgi:HEAT repeat protein